MRGWRTVLMIVLAAVLVGMVGHKPAEAYFTRSVLAKIADEAVKAYEPPTEWNENRPTVCRYDCGTFGAMRLVRRGVYAGHYGRNNKIAGYKAAFLIAVNKAGENPTAVRTFYDQNINAFLFEVVEAAKEKGYEYWDKSGNQHRQPMGNSETGDMLNAYATMVEEAVPYLWFAGQPVSDRLEWSLAEAIENWEISRKTEKGVVAEMVSESNLPFNNGGLETWKFGRRRYHSSPELLQTMTEIAEDMARRIQIQAEKLRE